MTLILVGQLVLIGLGWVAALALVAEGIVRWLSRER